MLETKIFSRLITPCHTLSYMLNRKIFVIYLFIYLLISFFIYLFIYFSYLFIYLFLYLFIYFSYLFIHLSIIYLVLSF